MLLNGLLLNMIVPYTIWLRSNIYTKMNDCSNGEVSDSLMSCNDVWNRTTLHKIWDFLLFKIILTVFMFFLIRATWQSWFHQGLNMFSVCSKLTVLEELIMCARR
jgi:hypothetical protein